MISTIPHRITISFVLSGIDLCQSYYGQAEDKCYGYANASLYDKGIVCSIHTTAFLET